MNSSRECPPQGTGRLAPRCPLKLIGYWAPASDGGLPWPDIRRAVRAGWQSAEREQLVAYLHNGHRCNGSLGFSACRFACRATYSILGSGELTDGEWVWPEGLPNYVKRHGVMLPEEFVASASAREWRVPPVDQVGAIVPGALLYSALRGGDMALLTQMDKSIREGRCEVDYAVWLEWAKRLPEVPSGPPPPDPRVLARFSLVVQYPDTDEPNERLDGFDEHVWAKLGEQYERHAPNVGDERVIEWISIEHQHGGRSLCPGGSPPLRVDGPGQSHLQCARSGRLAAESRCHRMAGGRRRRTRYRA
jgi:hypothetical protein